MMMMTLIEAIWQAWKKGSNDILFDTLIYKLHIDEDIAAEASFSAYSSHY